MFQNSPSPRRALLTREALFAPQRPDDPTWVKSDDPRDVEKLKQVETTVSSFVLCDIGRRFAETLRNHRLGQSGSLALCLQQLAKACILLSVDRLRQMGDRMVRDAPSKFP